MVEGGLTAIFLAQRPMLLRLLMARLGDRDEAEDVLQDMWMRIDQLDGGTVAQPAAFLYRVAANLATDRRIAARRRGTREAAWLDHLPEADDLPDAERAAIARDEWRRIEEAIDAMPERMAAALRLFRIEEQPQRVIAERLGISVSGVEKLLRRAYRKIHDRIEADAADCAPACRLVDERDMDRGG